MAIPILIWANSVIVLSMTRSHDGKQKQNLTNITIFSEIMIADHGICDHDLRKDIKIIV